jgi:hypothetical protein
LELLQGQVSLSGEQGAAKESQGLEAHGGEEELVRLAGVGGVVSRQQQRGSGQRGKEHYTKPQNGFKHLGRASQKLARQGCL